MLLLKYYPAQIKQRLRGYKKEKELANILNIYAAMYLQDLKIAKKYLGNVQLKLLEDLFLLPVAYEERDYFLAEKLSTNLLNQASLKYIAYEFLAKIKIAQQDYPLALKYAIMALEINSNDIIITLLADIYGSLNLTKEAYRVYSKISTLQAHSVDIYDKAAKKLSQLALSAAQQEKDYDQAIYWVKKSLSACKVNLEAWDFYLDLLQASNKISKMQKIIEEAWLECADYQLIKKYLKINNEQPAKFIALIENLSSTNLTEAHYLILAKLCLESNNEQKALMYLKKNIVK
jgi:hypothetical protein